MKTNMDAKTFGAIALNMLQSSQVAGAALDQALEFRTIAAALAAGDLAIAAPPPAKSTDEPNSDVGTAQ